MKICLVGPCSPHDLAEVLTDFDPARHSDVGFYRGIPVSTLATELLNANHEVEIVSTATGMDVEQLVFHGDRLKLTLVKGSSSARNRALTLFFNDQRNIAKALRTINSEIYHAHWTYEFALSTLMIKRNVLVTAHDAPFKVLRYYRDPYRFLRLLLAIIVRLNCKNLAAVSPNLASSWHSQLFWKRNISILPNFIPSDFSRVHSKQKHKDRIVLCVSDGSELKNVKSLIGAWNLIHSEAKDYNLVLVGHGLGKDEEIHKWAIAKGWDSKIVWQGYLERVDLFRLMDSAMVLCHPSLEESHCLVLLEALSLGLPVVAGKNSGAVPWSLGETSLLVDVCSEKEIADAILRLLHSPALREELSRLGVQHVQSKFSSEILLKKYIDLYISIIESDA